MSDAGEAREWRFYVRDMIGFCEKVQNYTEGLDQGAFVADELVYDATLRNLGLIGEAATRVPGAIREAHPEIPWRIVVGMRNRLARAYLDIDDDVAWSVVRDDVPALVPALRNLLNAVGEDA